MTQSHEAGRPRNGKSLVVTRSSRTLFDSKSMRFQLRQLLTFIAGVAGALALLTIVNSSRCTEIKLGFVADSIPVSQKPLLDWMSNNHYEVTKLSVYEETKVVHLHYLTNRNVNLEDRLHWQDLAPIPWVELGYCKIHPDDTKAWNSTLSRGVRYGLVFRRIPMISFLPLAVCLIATTLFIRSFKPTKESDE